MCDTFQLLMIAIVDYGMGNLRSVSKALEHLRADVRVTSEPADVARAQKVILPGVGAFGAAMRELALRKLIEPVRQAIAAGTPYLGICLGLQLLFESSEETPGVPGLSVLRGSVPRFTGGNGLKVPHMGWNQVTRHTSHVTRQSCPLLKDIPDESYFYFVHSYYAKPADPSVTALESEYGGPFCAMVWRDNVFATQFHPEKSQTMGLRFLKNFVDL